MLTSQQVTDKWARNTAAATESLKAGVMAVTQSPMAKAAAAVDRYVAGVQQAASTGRWAAGLNGVSLQDWQNAMLTKGTARIGQGVTAAKPKFSAFMDKWLPYQQNLQNHVAGMSRGSVSDSQARSAYAIAYNAAFSKRLPGS